MAGGSSWAGATGFFRNLETVSEHLFPRRVEGLVVGCACVGVSLRGCGRARGPMGTGFRTRQRPGCVWGASGEGTELGQGLAIPAEGKVSQPTRRTGGQEEPCGHGAGEPGLILPWQDACGQLRFLLGARGTRGPHGRSFLVQREALCPRAPGSREHS